MLAILLGSISSWAQTVTMRANPVRVTIPVGAAAPNPIKLLNANPPVSTNTLPVIVVTSALVANSTNVTFSMADVPSGVTATFGTNSIAADGTHTVFLTISSDATVAQGSYDMALVATGAANYRLPIPVVCSYIWSGANYTNNVLVPANLTAGANWVGGVAPSSVTDNLVFTDSGATTNIAGPTTTNLVISANKEVASVRFAHEYNWATNISYNIDFQSGAKLSVTGPGGFSLLRDSKATSRQMDVRMSGNGSLIVSNPAAMFGTFVDFQPVTTLDLRELDSLSIDVSRVPFGDYRAYPNYYTNGWQGTGTGGEINRFVSRVQLAKTNVIKASFVDPNNYNDLGQRDYALTIGNNNVQASTSDLWLQFGYSNALFLDSICFGQALAGSANSRFGFRNTGTGSYALFRGTGGINSRMSVLAVVDPASPAPPGAGNCRGPLNFLGGGTVQGGGTVDILVDRLMIAQDRTNNSGQMTVQGQLFFGAGTVDANNVYLGYQRSGNNQGAVASTGFAGPEGTLGVNSNAAGAGVLRVNQNLHLGFTTASAIGGQTSPERCFGLFTITNATAFVSNIVVGGTTKFSTNNQIHIHGGKLFVTNAIGSADGRVASLRLAGASEVTLLGVKVGETNVFVNTFTAATAGGVKFVKIPSIAGVGSYPVTIPLISYTSAASPVFNGLSIVPPTGVYVKTIIDNTTDKTIDVTFTDEPPIVVVWRGYTNNVWDVTTRNWVTQSGGVVTNYSEGFSVVFDDTVGAGPTAIDIPGAVTPGQVASAIGIVVSNQNYTFNAGGTILGSSTLKKAGTGNVTINATTSVGVLLSSGALAGNGTVGPTTLESGTTMTAFTGTINGGLITDGATVTVAGPVNGGLGLLSGSLVNSNTISGPITIAAGTSLDNRPGALINVNLPYTVSTNATLINNGDINHIGTPSGNLGLNVDGTLKGVGRIYQIGGTQLSSDVRVTVRPGGNLMIGNTAGEITNMTIAVRLDVNAGSHTTIDVDNTGTPVNDKIILNASPNGFGKVNFGIGNNLGGTIVINKTAGPAFGLATVINMFDQTSNTPDNQNQAVPGFIPSPGNGLVWDTSQILTNLTLVVTNQPALTNVFDGTNYVFTWPESLRGWRLERQITTLATGIEANNSTNWVTVASSLGGTNLYYPDTNNLSEFYFRSVQPISVNNEAVFYRMNYP